MNLDDSKIESILDAAAESLATPFRVGPDPYTVLEDLVGMRPEEFMRKYKIPRAEYDRMVASLSDLYPDDEGEAYMDEKDEKATGLILFYMALGLDYLVRDLQLDSYKDAVGLGLGDEALYYWRTVGDGAVCDVCLEYEANNPYRRDELPHKPHPWCRCWVEVEGERVMRGPSEEEINEMLEDFF